MLLLFRRIALAFGLLVGTLASQLPEYAQQYRQRLGGALDELTRQVEDFDAQAAHVGLGRDDAVTRLERNSDDLVRQRGFSMQETIARRNRLADQDKSFDQAGPFGRMTLLARDFDPGIARGAWARFEPAVPVTTEGIVCAAIGLFLGYGLWHGATIPFRRRLRRREQAYTRL